ncbi:MAG TPA: SRPBCC family protein [Gaiellaceae bacterium]|nr:SRPBCC family protein [Gaiellaceae bacterium]
MTPITGSVDIARPPQDVFDYANDLAKQVEWQSGLVGVEIETDGPTRVGTRAIDTRHVPGGTRTFPFEMTEFEPPSRSSFQVTAGPVRPHGTMTFEALDGGKGTRVTFTMEFHGHGLGVLLLPLVNRDARKLVPKDLETLKQRLESAG